VKVDRVACPWLISKFVDKNPEFIFRARGQGDGGSQAAPRHSL
jgi:hypothetical protein